MDGPSLAALLGVSDSITVGCADGSIDNATLGTADGTTDGTKDGSCETV